MRKIMFNDKYGLTDSVLNGRKTMTRRIGSPIYNVGEVIAIAQSYWEIWNTQKTDFRLKIGMESEANEGFIFTKFIENGGWNNKMFVLPKLMPYRIRITDIKVERLQEISDEDCLKEGVFECIDVDDCKRGYSTKFGYFHNTPREAFAELMNNVCGKGTWQNNPYVTAYEFELEGCEDD